MSQLPAPVAAGSERTPPTPPRPTGWWRWLPGWQMIRSYQAAWLKHDIFAGLVLTTMLVPVGIAYAEASGVPGIYGLYATIIPLLAYAVFGPSRILVLGPDSSLAAVILAVVLPLSHGDPACAIAVASLMAVVAGVFCIIAGVLRLGFITELLSKPIRYGYMNGIALTVLISQLPKLFGFAVEADDAVQSALFFVRALMQGQINPATLMIGAGTLAVILLLKPYRNIPGILLAVLAATCLTNVMGLGQEGSVRVLGHLPQGLPSFAWPWIGWSELRDIIIGGVAVALVAFADTSVLSRTYAAKNRCYVDPNQEMIGLGAANLAAGFFQGFPVSSSSSRTPVAEASGARSQVTGVVGALTVTLLLVAAPGLLENLPLSALAAVVVASALGLFEISELRRIYRIQKWEFWLSMVCFAGVVSLGAIPGIGLAIIISVVVFLWDGWRPHYTVLGRAQGVRGYHDIKRYPHARLIPGLVLFRWDAPLFFANAELFHESIMNAVASSPTPVKRVVIAAEPVTSVDVTSADTIIELIASLRALGIELHFAELKDPVKDKLKRFELYDQLGSGIFHPTIGAAVDDYLAQHEIVWCP